MENFVKIFIIILGGFVGFEVFGFDEYIKPPEPILSVDSFILIDANTGTVLAEKNSGMRVEPASLVKIMTTYVVSKALQAGHTKLSDKVVVSEKAWRMEGSRMFIEVGTKVSVDSLISGMIIQSGNDASVALAEHIYGSEYSFVNQMNLFADKLGLEDTNFGNVSGLPDSKTYTSAKDIVLLSQKLISEFPIIYKRFAEQTFTFNNITQRNRNILLRKSRFVDGIKTGYTESAKYCLVSSGTNGSIRLIAAVVGAKSNKVRFRDTKSLLDYGFRFFQSNRMFKSNSSVGEVRVWEGQSQKVAVGLLNDVSVLTPAGFSERVSHEIVIGKKLIAPIKKGQNIGKLKVKNFIEDENYYELVALNEVLPANMFKRLLDRVKLYFENNENNEKK